MVKIYFVVFLLYVKYTLNKKIKDNIYAQNLNDLYTFNYGTLNEIKINDKEKKELEISKNSEIFSSIFSYQLISKNNTNSEIIVKINSEEIILNKKNNNVKRENITLENKIILIKSNFGNETISIIIDIPKDKIEYINKNVENKIFEKEYAYIELPYTEKMYFSNLKIINKNFDSNIIYFLVKKFDSDFLYLTEKDKKEISSSFEYTLNNSQQNIILIKVNYPNTYIFTYSLFELENIKSNENFSLILNKNQEYKILKYENNPIRKNESKLTLQFEKTNFSEFYLYNNLSKIYFSKEKIPINYDYKSNGFFNRYEYQSFEKGYYYILFYNSKSQNYFDYLYIYNPGEQRELENNKTYYYRHNMSIESNFYFFKILKNENIRTLQLDFSFKKLSQDSKVNFIIYYWNSSLIEEKSFKYEITKNSILPSSILIPANDNFYFKIYINSNNSFKLNDIFEVIYFIYEGYNNIIDFSKLNKITMPIISENFQKKFFIDISNIKYEEIVKFKLIKHKSISNNPVEYKLNFYKNAKEGENEIPAPSFEKKILQEEFFENYIILSFKKLSQHTSIVILFNFQCHNNNYYEEIPTFSIEKIVEDKKQEKKDYFKYIKYIIIILVFLTIITIILMQCFKKDANSDLKNYESIQLNKLNI